MYLKVNGEEESVNELTLAAYLEARGLLGRRIAVEHNGEIVPKSAYESTTLHEGDVLEIVHAIGGG